MLTRVGSLPVSAINVGLVAALPGLSAKVALLSADLTKLGLSAVAKVQVSADFPPNPLSYAAAIGAALNPLEAAAIINPLSIAGGSVDLMVDAAIDLAFVTAQLEIAENLQAAFSAGLSTGGISGWSYAGRSSGFGSELETRTSSGFGRTAPDARVQAVIISTESFASWGSFSQGVNTGSSAAAPATADRANLAYLGELAAGKWNSGVASIAVIIDQLVAELRGAKSAVEGSVEFALGLDLPDPQVIVDAGLSIVADVGIDGLLDNMLNVQADIGAAIGEVQAKIDALAEFTSSITAQLSAGGLMLWTYTGRGDGLGAALAAELAQGIPGGSGPSAPAYGLVLAGTPASMTTFGSILKTS